MLSKVYYDPRGKGTVQSGPNCVCSGESGENFDAELFVSGPQPVARGVAMSRPRTKQLSLLTCLCRSQWSSGTCLTAV